MKKILAVILSILMCVSLATPALALDLGGLLGGSSEGEGGGINIGDLLESPIVESLLTNEGIMDVTGIIIQLIGTMNQENLQAMGKEKVEEMIQSMIEELGWQLSAITGNKDLVLTYDPVKVMGNLFNVDLEELTTKDPEENEDSNHPDELVIGLGDVDGDGKLTAADARLTLRAAAQMIELTMQQEANADVDKDGKITAMDARLILRAVTGMETLG